MDYKWLLFRFEGRVNRASYWLSALIVLCGALVAAIPFLFGAAMVGGTGSRSFVFDTQDLFRILDPVSWRAALDTLHGADAGTLLSVLFRVVVSPVVLWCYAATSIKRLHDRNKTGWWTLPFFVAPGLYSQFEDRLGESTVVVVLGFVFFILLLWGLIELAFLKGTHGPNRFGPDPLAPADPAAARPRWDQQRELEFVPHMAGPSPGPHVNPGHE